MTEEASGQARVSVRDRLSRAWDRLGSWILTLRVMIMGLVAVSVIIPAILTGLLANRFLNHELQRELNSNSRIRNERLAAKVSEWFNGRLARVRAATNSPYLFSEQAVFLGTDGKGTNTARAKADVDRYLSYLVQDNPNFQGFAVLTEKGDILSVHPLSIKPLLAKLLSGRPGEMPPVLETDTVEGNRVFIVQKVGGTSRERNLFLAGLLKTEDLVRIMTEGTTTGALAYLVDKNGIIKEATSPGAVSRTLPPEGKGLFDPDIDAKTYDGLLGGKVIGSASKIDNIDWWLVSEMSRGEALKKVAKFRIYIVYVTLVIVGLLLLPALFLARTIVIPLEELSGAARRIGLGEYGIQVKPAAGGELGEFINAFNTMSLKQLKTHEELRAATQQLAVMSITDPLTGRANRRFMEEQLERSIKVAQRKGTALSLLMLDLDHFKRYNDTYGHLGGDEALKQVGDLLVASVRDTDYVSRFGGEEFLISLEGASKENAARVAEKIRAAMEGNVFTIEDAKTRITASLGVASYPQDGETSKSLLEAADRALYKAKDRGRNRVCLA